jgi:hypothetical protein
MPITLNCTCGKTLRVADEHAGRRVKCPACNAVIAPPAPQPEFEVIEDAPRQQLAASKPAARPRVDDDEDEGGSYGMAAAEKAAEPPKPKPNFRKSADPDDEENDHPVRRKRRKRSAAQAGADEGKRGAYMIGGIFMIVAGIGLTIWGNSGTGRAATKLMIFGICLGVCGLVSLVRGITGNIPEGD